MRTRRPRGLSWAGCGKGIRERFGFGGEPEEPVPLEEVELRPVAVEGPGGVWRPVHGRALRAGDACAGEGLPGCGAGVSGGVREPAGPGGVPTGRVRDRGGAELVRGGGRRCRAVRGRDQRRRRGRGAARRAAGRLARPAAAGPGAGGRRRVAGGADPGGRDRPGAGGAASRARADPAPLPPVLRVLDARRLDRDPGRRPLRDPLHPHRRPGRVGAGDHPARDLGEPAAAGLRRRALARPDADRLGGHPRRDRRGLGAGAAAARVQGLLRGRVRRLPRRRARRARDLPVGPVPLQLPPARRARGGDDRRRLRREEPAGAGLRVRPPPGRRRRWSWRWRSPASTAARRAR